MEGIPCPFSKMGFEVLKAVHHLKLQKVPATLIKLSQESYCWIHFADTALLRTPSLINLQCTNNWRKL